MGIGFYKGEPLYAQLSYHTVVRNLPVLEILSFPQRQK